MTMLKKISVKNYWTNRRRFGLIFGLIFYETSIFEVEIGEQFEYAIVGPIEGDIFDL